jgi:hypothetical protein
MRGSITRDGRRFCTDDDPVFDDHNRKAVIGYPDNSYPFESEVRKNGTYTKFCVQQTIKAHMTGIPSSSSWSLGGTVSKESAGVSFTYTSGSDEGTVTVARNAVCDADIAVLRARVGDIRVTAENDSGEVVWVHLTSTITAQYKVGGTKYGDTYSLGEYDYS